MGRVVRMAILLSLASAPTWAQKPPLLPEKDVAALAQELSGETAKRNLEGITRFGRTLVVNPGSATLPRNLVDLPGTVAILEIATGGCVSAEIIRLG